jgi:hypothetical protein
MVSQPTMQRIFGLPTCLVGLTAGFLLFAACGQNEGGRCQINSDCASGLECKDGTSGNGVCRVKGAVVTNDAALQDVAEDVATLFTSEVGSEVAVTSEIDAESVAPGAVDSGSLDSNSID